MRAFTFPIKVRLDDCWAPEKRNPGGKEATQRLAELMPLGVRVKVFIDTSKAKSPFDLLTFDRLLAFLWVVGFENEPPVNLQMVREGFATEKKIK